MRSNILLYAFLSFTLFVHPTYASDKPIELQLMVSPDLGPYTDALFESPAYAAMALQNAGVPVSLSKPVKILSRHSIEVGSERLNFISKKDSVYYYKAAIGLPLGKSIDIPVEIDSKNLSSGQLKITAYAPLAGYLPKDVTIKVESKLQTLASINSQKLLLKYLAMRSGGKLNSKSIAQLYESIAFDSYNDNHETFRSNTTLADRNVGASELLSDQVNLIIAVAIWLVGLPTFLIVFRRGRAKHRDSSEKA